MRLNDSVGGFSNVNTPCDFIAFTHKSLFLLECKSHDGNSIPFSAMPQLDRLLKFEGIDDVYAGFVIWFKDKDILLWVDANVAEQIRNDGHKSISLSLLKDNKYNIFIIPSTKERVYLTGDYTSLLMYY